MINNSLDSEHICFWCGKPNALFRVNGRGKKKYWIHLGCYRKMFFLHPLWYIFGIPKNVN